VDMHKSIQGLQIFSRKYGCKVPWKQALLKLEKRTNINKAKQLRRV